MKNYYLPTLAFAAIFATPLANATTYIITDLGTLGGSGNSYAYGLNNLGQVVGTSNGHAFLYDSTGMHDLGTLDAPQSEAVAINDNGQITGNLIYPHGSSSGQLKEHAFLYDSGTMVDIHNQQNSGLESSVAKDINNNGQIVGHLDLEISNPEAFIYSSGVFTTIDVHSAGLSKGIATSINDSGQVSGYAQYKATNATNHAFLYDSGTVSDLGTFGNPYYNESEAYDINNSGQVLGRSIGVPCIFEINYNFMHALGQSPNHTVVPRRINDYGISCGFTSNSSGPIATVYENELFRDLNTMTDASGAGWVLNTANDINNLGQIVGYGQINGEYHAYLATPNSVPEPATLALLGLGATALLRRKSRA